MRKHINRIISITLAAAMSVSMISSISASAEEITAFPYTLFAASEAEGAITTTAGNFCVNGNVCTNGTIVAGGNINVNGTKTENAGQDMIYIFDKIDTKYFSGNNVEEHTEDYVLDELNINISTPTEVLGEAELTGNININTALKAFEDVTLNGEVKNTNDSVIYSKYGDIVIDSTNVNLNGLVYAPFGSVEVKAMNLNLNNVVIIADSIVFDCPNVNANYSTNAADFVGMISEPLNIPKDEWPYMKYENGNGLPDFFEDFDNWEKLSDTDGDGLPDSIEEYLGSDSNNIDTDGDGLGDYYEVFVTYTDPTMADTDENGVSDADEDFDEDGLTNLDEFLNNTYPYIDDSDNDGLSDGDEVNKYGTDPLVADTDGDGLDDGDEIVLDTNPLVQDTDGDGIIDSKEKFQQTYTHKVNNEDCAVTEVIVDMECTGNINKTTSVESVMNVDILCTDVVGLIGEPFEIETTSEFDTATLTFTIDKSKLGETEFDNLLFLWYNEEENDFVELETTLDEENSTASIVTTHFSKYMVIDKYKWFEALAVEFDYNPTGGSSTPDIPVKYNTVLAIDCSGSMDWNDPISTKSGINSADEARYPHTCNRITAAEGFIRYMNSNDETAIVLFTDRANTAAPMTTDKESLKLALQKMYSNGGTSFSAALNASIKQIDSAEKITYGANKNRIILLSDGDDGDSASRRNVAIQKCKDKFIEVYTVGFGSANDAILQNIAYKTGGKYYKAMNAQDIVDIFAKFGYMDDFDMTDTDGDGLPDAVEAAGIRLQNGKLLRDVDSDGIIFTDPANPDTDGDGLLDGKEIDPTPQLHTIPEFALPSSSCGPVQSKPSYYFKAISDPRKKDSDGDYLCDNCDKSKLSHNNLPKPICDYLTEQKINCCNVRTSDDGFVFVGESITELLTNLGVTYDYDIYDDWHLFCVSSNDVNQFGLCKLRTANDLKGPSFALPFYYFELDEFNALCNNKEYEAIDDMLDNYTSQKFVHESDLLLNYFSDASNKGFYILADAYIQEIIKFEQIVDKINVLSLNVYQKATFDSLASNLEKNNQCFYISDPKNLTNLEKDKILLLRSGNPNVYSFAAEINYHAQMAINGYGITRNLFTNANEAYQHYIMLFSLNLASGELTENERSSLDSLWEDINKNCDSKFVFKLMVRELIKHALKSDAGVGTSGTLSFEEFLSKLGENINFDIFIQNVFYDDNSYLVQQARLNHSEDNAYNY